MISFHSRKKIFFCSVNALVKPSTFYNFREGRHKKGPFLTLPLFTTLLDFASLQHARNGQMLSDRVNHVFSACADEYAVSSFSFSVMVTAPFFLPASPL